MNRAWEQYARCVASDIPAETRWDASSLPQRSYEVHFGGPPRAEPHRWGSPWRRVVELNTGRVHYSRYRRVEPPRETPEDE